jgi:hypothetical protein
MVIWYNVSIIVLAFLLYRPVKKLVLAGRFNRAAKKLGRDLTEDESKEIEKKTFPLVVAIVIIFSLLFNYMLSGKLYNIK